MKPLTKILFLVPYPVSKAPSQRFRVESFFSEIEKAGLHFSVHPFLDQKTGSLLYRKGHVFLKTWGIIKGFIRRSITVFFKVPFYQYVFIHRESAPLGPPIFEWIIARVYRKKIIYDFDDAIWIPNTSFANQFINWLKAFWKVKYICKWSYKISVGNDYLYNYAIQFNKNVIKIPTSIDIKNGIDRIYKNHEEELNVGWTGSHSTLKYLDEVVPAINELQRDFNFKFLVIADKNPLLSMKNFEFIPWNINSETNDLLKFDVGIMPLLADVWSEGKCGFKLIQYFACGIPAIASPVGVNKIIIEEGVNGFLCTTQEEWKLSLEKLLRNGQMRQRMGMEGRKKIEKEYSIQSQASKFIELFS